MSIKGFAQHMATEHGYSDSVLPLVEISPHFWFLQHDCEHDDPKWNKSRHIHDHGVYKS